METIKNNRTKLNILTLFFTFFVKFFFKILKISNSNNRSSVNVLNWSGPIFFQTLPLTCPLTTIYGSLVTRHVTFPFCERQVLNVADSLHNQRTYCRAIRMFPSVAQRIVGVSKWL
jgi:hypothetical protein